LNNAQASVLPQNVIVLICLCAWYKETAAVCDRTL